MVAQRSPSRTVSSPGARGGTGGRVSVSRFSRGAGFAEVPPPEPEARRGLAFTTHDLFSWGGRHNGGADLAGRKRLKIPVRAFGPPLAEARDSRTKVRERFKNYFQFPRENRVTWREDVDEVRRNRTRLVTAVLLAVAYTVFQLAT
jgi:hypothetical protein